MFLQDERGRNGCIFCLIILRFFFGVWGERVLVQRCWKNGCRLWLGCGCLLLERSTGWGSRELCAGLALLWPVEVCCSSQMAYQCL